MSSASLICLPLSSWVAVRPRLRYGRWVPWWRLFVWADFLFWGGVMIRVSGLAGTFCRGIRFVRGGRFDGRWRGCLRWRRLSLLRVLLHSAWTSSYTWSCHLRSCLGQPAGTQLQQHLTIEDVVHEAVSLLLFRQLFHPLHQLVLLLDQADAGGQSAVGLHILQGLVYYHEAGFSPHGVGILQGFVGYMDRRVLMSSATSGLLRSWLRTSMFQK